MEVRVTLDRDADAAYIYLREIGPAESAYQCAVDCDGAEGMILLDLDREGRLIGIEVLNAQRGLPAEVLEAAEV